MPTGPLAGIIADIYDTDVAQTVRYVTAGGSSADIPAVWDIADRTIDGAGGDLVVERRVVWVRRSDVPVPAEGDTVIIDGVPYRVIGRPLLDETSGEWEIEVRRA